MGGKALVLQSGGPTRVINRSLYGVVDELDSNMNSMGIERIYGSLNGVRGILDQDFVDLTEYDRRRLRNVAYTPASALGTTRYELVEKDRWGEIRVKEADLGKAMKVLTKHDVRYLFTIGGGDSSETAQLLAQGASDTNYQLSIVHIPKTIDNDLLITDHCPGYGSAATYVVNCLLGKWFDDMANRKTVDLNVIMGRDAGWLAASAAFCRTNFTCNPLIITPERPMDIEEFLERAGKAYKNNGGLLQIAVSEGARDRSGKKWAKQLADRAGLSARTDETGRDILSDIPLAALLAPAVRERTGARVVADTLGYAQRSYLGAVSKTDGDEAEWVGREGVKMAAKGESGIMVTIQRHMGWPSYRPHLYSTELSNVAQPGKKLISEVPPDFFDQDQPNNRFTVWLEPLLGEIPETDAFVAGAFGGRRVPQLVLD